MQSKRLPLWLLWLLPLLFVVFLVILLQFRSIIYERLVVRLAEIGWYAGLVVNSISQEVYFVVLLVIVLVTCFGIVLGLYLRASAIGEQKRATELTPVSRARHWTELIYVRAPIQYTRELMHNEVRRLLLVHLGFEDVVDREIIDAMIESGEIKVPREIAPFLSKRRHEWERPHKKPTRWQAFRRWIDERTGKDSDRNVRREPIDAQLEHVAAYLESQLEAPDDTG